ncbi:50S ribosomal protein L24 [Candidatus Micrarchaeota archaeon]|nr:50S ribosomal protein L24 [Candidatus Micrarchaeota archaeon]
MMNKISSKKPGVQRKAHFTRHLHRKCLEFRASLSKELRKALGKRSLTVRKGDTVKVMRGGHRGFSGKVAKMKAIKYQVFLEKLNRKKTDGTEVLIPLKASNLMITELEKSDEKRVKGMKIKGKAMGNDAKKEVKKDEKKADVKKVK